MNKTKAAIGIGVVFFILLVSFITASKTLLPVKNKSYPGVGLSSDFTAQDSVSPRAISGRPPQIFSEEKAVLSAPVLESEEGASEERKIIKNGNISLRVGDVDWAVGEIAKMARENGGEIQSSSVSVGINNLKNGYVTLKVPAANFEKTFSELRRIASLVSDASIFSSDVAEQYQDLESRIANKKSEEEAYKNILEKAQKVDDIISITRELSRVRGEIELFEQRKKRMDDQIAMSVINVSLQQEAGATTGPVWRPVQEIKEAFGSLVKNLRGFVDFLIKLFVVAVPIGVLYGVLIWIFYRIGKKILEKIKKNPKSKENSTGSRKK